MPGCAPRRFVRESWSGVNWVLEDTEVPFERISIDPTICHGQACVKGTRIPVHQIVRMLAHGDPVGDLLVQYPTLSRADIMACLDYAAELAEEQLTPLPTLGG
ncbi:MAG: DUF433 domain-containing protein [Bryobacterales bacterium]|nr:DUF433 domain-containing protein [Bryobacterales bacterium]